MNKKKLPMKSRLNIVWIIFLTTCYTANAQSWQWGREAHTLNGAGSWSYATAADANGNVYITGIAGDTSVVFGTDTFNLHGFFLTKYDSLGNLIWSKSAYGSYIAPSSLTVDKFGGLYMTGNADAMSVFGHDTIPNDYAHNMFLVKYDSSGNVRWLRSSFVINPGFPEQGAEGNEVSVDTIGNIYVVGNFQCQALVLGTDTLRNQNDSIYNLFLVKYDTSGNEIWARQSTSDNATDGFFTYVTADGLGNAYLAFDLGFVIPFLAFGNDTVTKMGNGPFIVKYDALGNLKWAKSLDDIGGEIRAITTDVSNNLIIAGFFAGNGVFGADTLTYIYPGSGSHPENLFVAKYDSSGNAVWAKNAGGSCWLLSVVADDTGNIYVAGNFYPTSLGDTFAIGTDAFTTSGSNGIIVAKYSSSGTWEWAGGASGNGFQSVSGISADPAGENIYVTGTFTSNSLVFAGDDLSCDTLTANNVFLAKLNPLIPAKVSAIEKPSLNVSVYPNPVTKSLLIESTNVVDQITISNLLGQTVFSKCYKSKEIGIDVSNLPSGLYLIKIGDLTVRKFVKE